MARRAVKAKEEAPDPLFIGTMYSNQECEFLIVHLGEPSEVAIPEDEELPVGVNPAAVIPILDRTYRLHLMEQAAAERHPDIDMKVWVGFDALKDVLVKTLEWNATVAELKRRTRHSDPTLRRAAAAPSLHLWDPDTDIPYLYGVGSDSDFVRTALGPNGTRENLFTELRDTGVGGLTSLAGVAKFIRSKTPEEQRSKTLATTPNALVFETDGDHGTIKCPLCGFGQPYELLKTASKKKALDMVKAHLLDAPTKKDQHRILSQRLNSGRAGRGAKVQDAEPDAE